jgi:hypothetical protein
MTTTPDDATTLPDYDSDTWIEVPLDFPVGGFDSAEQWADDLAEDALGATSADDGTRAGVREAALAVANHTRGLASRRFWYFPLLASTVTLVQYYELPREPGIDDVLVEFLGYHEHRSTDPVVTELVSSSGERLVRVAFLVGEVAEARNSAVFGVMRIARVSEHTIDLFELMDEDLVTASQVVSDLELLAASVGRGAFVAPVEGGTPIVTPAVGP